MQPAYVQHIRPLAGARMFERFNEKAIKAVMMAQEEK
jgi:hypothetical protein